ncbi:MAG: MFS transporter [Spirochaetaceae bacterium]
MNNDKKDNTVKGYRRASTSEVVRYGFGGIGSNIPFFLTLQFLMYFLTDHFGISAAAVGGLFLFSRLIDAITDPLMGMLADRTKSKIGKYRPYIIWGAPVLGLLTVMLFWTPDLSTAGKIVYIYIIYIMYSLVSTVVNIPYHSLTPILSQDPDQRTVIATFKQVLGIVGIMFVSVGAIPITKALGGGSKAWTIFAIISAVLLTLSFWLCASGAKKHDRLEHYKKENSTSGLSIREQLKLITKNKALLMLMIAFGTDMIAYAAASAVNIYYFTYAVKRPDLIASTMGIGVVFSILVSIFIPFLSKRVGKKPLFLAGSAILMILSFILFFVPFTSVSVIFVLAVLTMAFGPLTGVVGWSMLADCVEYGEWKTGLEGAGTVSSQLTFVNKLGMALGGFIGGTLISMSGYIPGADQAETVLKTIVGIKTLLPVAGYIASLISMSFYPITKEFYSKMISDNELRRQKQ